MKRPTRMFADDVHEQLLKVLTSHYRSLVESESREDLLKRYSSLLRFMKREPAIFDREPKASSSALLPQVQASSQIDLKTISLSELRSYVDNEETTRKELERVASERFSVPTGSMRSFSSRRMLIEKILTLIENEQAHSIIGSVARGGNKQR